MTEEAKHPYYLRCLWGEKLQEYSEEGWTQTGEPCWDDFQKEQIILPEGLPEKILEHLKSGYCAIIGPENTGKTWLCYGLGFELEKEGDVWYVDKGDLEDIEVDEMLNFLEKYIRESKKSSCLIVEDCHRNEKATRMLLMRGRKIENLSVLFTTKKTDESILKDVSGIKLPDYLLTSGEDYAKRIIEKFIEIEGLRGHLDNKDLENSAKIGGTDLSQLSECLNEWVERVRKGGLVKTVKLTRIIEEKRVKSVNELSGREKDIIREIRLKLLGRGLISSASQDEISYFYSGKAPLPGSPSAWDVIATNKIVKRDQEEEIVQQALQEDANFHIICIVAEPGAGKTTLAMRVLYRLSQQGEYSFWLADKSEYNSQFWHRLPELAELINNRFYVFIDDIFRDNFFVDTLKEADKRYLPVTIIATSRINEYKDNKIEEFLKKIELKVSEEEKTDLLKQVGKSYVDLSDDERKDFNETNLFLVLGMVLSKGKGFSKIIKELVEGLEEKDEALYRAFEYVCFFSNYDISIPLDLLINLDKQGRFTEHKLLEDQTAKGIFYEDFSSYSTRLIKAGHQLIAKEALSYYRHLKVLFEEILEAADEGNWTNMISIAYLTRAILEEGQSISKKDIKDIITRGEKIANILQYASISELNLWKMIYKHLNLQEEAEKCSEKILLLSPNTSPECQLLVSEFLNKGLVDKAFSTMREWSEEHSEDRMIFTKYLSLVKDKGDQDEVEKAIEEITKWLKGHPEDNIIRELYIVLIRDKGNQGQVEKAIEEITKWLKGHPEDNMICSDYLALVRDRCFLEEYIRPALGDAEQRMKKHGSHPLFQDYIPLVKKILKTKSEIEIDVELVKQFGYEIIDLWEQEDKVRYNKWIINFAELLLLMGCLNEYEQIYKMLHELNLNPETKSALRFRYGKKFLGEAMNPELTNDERIEKLRRAEVTFREVLEIHRGHYMAYVFLYITLKEEGRDNEAEKELKHAKWWFPLNVKMKELVLFSSIPSNYNFEHLLNRGIIPKEIKNDFDIKGNPLSRSATIKMIMRDRWEITDKSSAYPYYIVLIDKIKRGETNEYKLNTYGKFHPGRIAYKIGKFYLDFYSYKEAEYWLEMATKEEPEDFTNWWKSGVAKMELALIIEEKVSHKEAIDIYAEALSDLETALEKAGESLQLPASKDIPERIAKCRKHLLS